jgi:hypothetical protein
MELVEKFAPSNLPNLIETDFVDLKKEDIQLLASVYPIMQPKLLIAKVGTVAPKSPATYKSLYSLLFSGHKFYIAGTMFGKPKEVIDTESDIKMAQAIATDDFVAPEGDIFQDKTESPATTVEAPQTKKEAVQRKQKPGRKSNKK